MSATVFMADLHLSDDVPELNALFVESLARWRGKIDALYILGDLFDVWVGDDDDSFTARQAAQALREFTAQTPAYFIAGNRDFLLGNTFARACGLQRLPENSVIELYGQHYLLAHGDEMCTDDVKYQRFRRIIRNPLVCAVLRNLPLARRRQIAARMREASRERKREIGKSEIADVTELGVQAALCRHPEAAVLIHGHTHRPAVHNHQCGSRSVRRYVLPDWYGTQGGCLTVSPDGVCFESLPPVGAA